MTRANPRTAKPYPPEVKAQAKARFLTGETLPSIAAWVQQVTGRPCNASLIYHWVSKAAPGEPSAKEVRAVQTEQILSKVAEIEGGHRLAEMREMLSAYDRMWRKGDQELKVISSEDAEQAMKLVDQGIRGHQFLMAGVIHVKFAQAMAKILDTFVVDPVQKREAVKMLREALAEVGIT